MTGCLPELPGVRGCGLCLVERDRENVSAVTTLTEDGFGLTDPGDSLRNGERERQWADKEDQNHELTC